MDREWRRDADEVRRSVVVAASKCAVVDGRPTVGFFFVFLCVEVPLCSTLNSLCPTGYVSLHVSSSVFLVQTQRLCSFAQCLCFLSSTVLVLLYLSLCVVVGL